MRMFSKHVFIVFFIFVLVLLSLTIRFISFFFYIAGALTKSQFPVFTIYAQKSCLTIRPCSRAWCIDRVQSYKLNGYVKRSTSANSRRDCLEMCLGENEFTCRWVKNIFVCFFFFVAAEKENNRHFCFLFSFHLCFSRATNHKNHNEPITLQTACRAAPMK